MEQSNDARQEATSRTNIGPWATSHVTPLSITGRQHHVT